MDKNDVCDEKCAAAGHPKIKFEDESSRADMLVEKCGVFGCIANGEWPTDLGVASIVCLGLSGLQHRGQEAAGIVTCSGLDENHFNAHRGMGLVSQCFNEPTIAGLKGNLGIGHNRYSTTGGSENVALAQPFIVHTSYGVIAVAHNGELVNSKQLRRKILQNGVGLSTGSDSELLTQCLSMAPPPRFMNKHLIQGGNKEFCQEDQTTPTQEEHKQDERFPTPPLTSSSSSSSKSSTPSNGGSSTRGNELSNCSSSDKWPKVLSSEEKEDALLSRLLHLMSLTPLSYSLVIMYDQCLYAIRDPFGNRPLCIGMLFTAPETGQRSSQERISIDGWVVSSESCSFPSVSAKVWRDIEPGEIVKLERNKLPKTLAVVPRPQKILNSISLEPSPAFCIMEHVYFARPDSVIDGQMVYSVREKSGRRLAIEAGIPIPADNDVTHKVVVAPIPETAIPAAHGYAKQAGIPFVEVFSRNRYIGRTFIQPSARLRRVGVSRKFGPLSANFSGKTVILVDDSIVRGTTIGQLVRLLKENGAVDVHIRIACPPLHYPCYMGINIPTREELIANHLSPSQLASSLGAASLVHLSVEGLRESVESGIREHQAKQGINKPVGHCMACLTGDYPSEIDF